MLQELNVENLVVIERARLALAPGLNVFTGETGAGKTVLAHALTLLRGERPGLGAVRPGADEAYVEGIFAIGDHCDTGPINDLLSECAVSDGGSSPAGEELILARRVFANGRTRAYVNGRSVSVELLRGLGSELLGFCGQNEHRSLVDKTTQRQVLDRFCGIDHGRQLALYGETYEQKQKSERKLEDLREAAHGRDQELQLLDFEIAEIESVAPSVEEEQALLEEHPRVRHAETLRQASLAAAEAIDSESDARGAQALLAQAEVALRSGAGLEEEIGQLGNWCARLAIEAQELAGQLRAYGDRIDGDPDRLAEVEGRLAELDRVKKKHGDSIAEVTVKLDQLRKRRAGISGVDSELATLASALEDLGCQLEKLGLKITQARQEQAPRLAGLVQADLGQLGLAAATFEVVVESRSEDSLFGPSGMDEVEFLFSANPGSPLGRLRGLASGGELSRLLLAVMCSAAYVERPTLVFDEIDAGIGGLTARRVGERLRKLALSDGHQVICITHLAQIAALAERHFCLTKRVQGERASTGVAELSDRQTVSELCRMLGADESDDGARQHVEELLAAA